MRPPSPLSRWWGIPRWAVPSVPVALGQIGYQYGYIGYNATVMNTVLVLLVILVYLIQFVRRPHRPGCHAQVTLQHNTKYSLKKRK